MGDSTIPIPDTSQLPIESRQSQYNLQNANVAMTPQPGPPPPVDPWQNAQLPANAIQQSQQQYQPAMSESLGIPQGIQQPSPYDEMRQFLNQRIQADQQKMHGVKGYLTGLGQGFAEHALNSFGVLTPGQRQQEDMGKLMAVNRAQEDAAYKQSETAKNLWQMQTVQVAFPGEAGQPDQVIEVPIQHAGAAQGQAARIRQAQQQRDQALAQRDPLLDVQRLQGLAVQEAVRNGRDPATDPAVLSLNKQYAAIQAGRPKSVTDTAGAEKEEVRTLLQPALANGEVTGDAFLDLRKLTTQVHASKSIPADAKSKILSWYAVNGSPAATGAQVNVRIASEAEKAGGKPVFAYDPATRERVQTTPEEAKAKGYTNLIPVKEADVAKETDARAMINDVQLNKSRYQASMDKFYQESKINPPTTKQAAAMIALTPEHLGMDFGQFFKLELPEVMQKVTNASAFAELTDTQKQAVLGYYSTLASVPAAQKALTNIGRANKEMMDLELRTIPSPIMDQATLNHGLERFQGNIDQTSHKTVRVLGLPSTQEIRDQWEGTRTTAPVLPTAPRGGATHIYDPKTGTAFPIPGVMR